MWPFNGPTTAFWPPLAFASLAAALRDAVGDLAVEILDCPSLQLGWKSLSGELADRRPAYVGIGEEAVSAAEGFRLAQMAKDLGATVIAGGCTFGNLADEVLSTGLVDVVVRGEGERTVVELIEALRERDAADALSAVSGIAFLRGGEVVKTARRPLIDNLDNLPMPAWDLLPVERYGKGSRNHPDLASIEHGRGCTASCGYCILWRQMGHEGPQGRTAHYRTKSPERVMEEIRLLTGRYGRRYLCWVDPCFNADAVFLAGLTEKMLSENMRIGQNAWVRADCLLRDERSGLLAHLVNCGLNEIFVGVERVEAADLAALERSSDGDAARRVLPGISRKYPALYLVGSFIYGVPGDSWRTVKAMRDATIDLNLDMAFYIPLTGLPGTKFWDGESWDVEAKGLGKMNFLTSCGPRAAQVQKLTALLAASFLLDIRPRRVAYVIRTLTARDPRKRRMNRRLFARGAAFALRRLSAALLSRNGTAMPRPRWYDK